MQYDMNEWELAVCIHRLSFNNESSAITCRLYEHETKSSECKVKITPNSDGRNICKVSFYYSRNQKSKCFVV